MKVYRLVTFKREYSPFYYTAHFIFGIYFPISLLPGQLYTLWRAFGHKKTTG